MDIGENEGQGRESGLESLGPSGRAGPDEGPRAHSRWTRIPRALGRGGRHHLRLMAVVAAVAVVGGAGGYVALASTGAPSSHGGGPDGLRMASATSTDPTGPSAAGPDVGGSEVGGSAATGTGSVACPMIPASPGATGGTGEMGSATHVFTRTTAGGVTIRTYDVASTGSCLCGPISMPPSTSDLRQGGSVSVELSDDSAVGQGALFVAADPTATTADAVTEPTAVVSGAFGVAEGASAWWTAVSVGPDVASVEMTFGGGSTDQMAPVDGVAVLAHLIDPSVASSGDGPYQVRGTVRLLDASGAVIASVTIPRPSTTPPGPPPIADPTPTPVLPPSSVPASRGGHIPVTTTTSGPAGVSPPASTGSVVACPDAVGPVNASAG